MENLKSIQIQIYKINKFNFYYSFFRYDEFVANSDPPLHLYGSIHTRCYGKSRQKGR